MIISSIRHVHLTTFNRLLKTTSNKVEKKFELNYLGLKTKKAPKIFEAFWCKIWFVSIIIS